MKLIYVIGRYRASSQWELEQNIRHAEQAAIKLWLDGWAVICPHKNTAYFGGLAPDDVWLDGDLEIIKRCDAVYVLKGWQQSGGSRVEVALAKQLELEIIYEE